MLFLILQIKIRLHTMHFQEHTYLKSYCGEKLYDSPRKYSEVEIKGMLGFLVDDIYEGIGDQALKQSVDIPMGTNCALLLTDLSLYSYKAEFADILCPINEQS
jgi:hypothetical protein